jgi:flagellar basal body rod protein FlgB
MNRIRIEPPEGELLPAEERLQNVLKAIEDRVKLERAYLNEIGNTVDLDTQAGEDAYNRQHYYLSGLDIAWSLVKTESLRRQTPDTQN